MSRLVADGWTIIPTGLPADTRQSLRDSIFSAESAGQRCMLDQPDVRHIAGSLRADLIERGFLPAGAVAIQAIAFDKTATVNWRVTWHQDLVFPFARPVTSPGFEAPSVKDGIAYARPPREVLEDLLAVRLHLDDCDETNGPLRVASGTHRQGILKASAIPSAMENHAETVCLAKEGEALLMKPLLLHASSPATVPKHRRVLHLVYHIGEAIPETWHRAV
jgi:hypothetical protein